MQACQGQARSGSRTAQEELEHGDVFPRRCVSPTNPRARSNFAPFLLLGSLRLHGQVGRASVQSVSLPRPSPHPSCPSHLRSSPHQTSPLSPHPSSRPLDAKMVHAGGFQTWQNNTNPSWWKDPGLRKNVAGASSFLSRSDGPCFVTASRLTHLPARPQPSSSCTTPSSLSGQSPSCSILFPGCWADCCSRHSARAPPFPILPAHFRPCHCLFPATMGQSRHLISIIGTLN